MKVWFSVIGASVLSCVNGAEDGAAAGETPAPVVAAVPVCSEDQVSTFGFNLITTTSCEEVAAIQTENCTIDGDEQKALLLATVEQCKSMGFATWLKEVQKDNDDDDKDDDDKDDDSDSEDCTGDGCCTDEQQKKYDDEVSNLQSCDDEDINGMEIPDCKGAPTKAETKAACTKLGIVEFKKQ